MKNQYVLNGLTVTGTVLLLMGMGGTAQAIPVSAAHHATTSASAETSLVSSHSLGAEDLFGAAEDRIGSANFSSSALPQVHHLNQPPKTSAAPGITSSSSAAAGVPDGGKTAMMLGGALSGMMLARRKIPFRTT